MARVKRGNVARKRRKKVLKAASGFRGAQSRLFTVADRAVTKAGKYAYADRRRKKREFRRLWITRINAATRALGIRYSTFIALLKSKQVELDRKQLAELAMNHPESFKALVESIRS